MHFSKTGKMSCLALENSHLSAKKPSDSGVVYCACGVWTLCQPMDASSKLTNIVDQSDPQHDCYKGCEIIYVCFMLKPTLEMTFF